MAPLPTFHASRNIELTAISFICYLIDKQSVRKQAREQAGKKGG